MKDFKDFNSKLDGISQIIGVLSKNLEILKKVSKFGDHYDEINQNYKKLIDLHVLYCKDISTLETRINSRRHELLDKTMTVIKVLQVYATDKEKTNLQLRLELLSFEYLNDCSDLELIKISKKVWLTATKVGGYSTTFLKRIKSALNPENSKANLKFEKKYGLTSEMIKDIEEAIISFIESMVIYQQAFNKKINLSGEMKQVFKETKKLLSKKTDKFVLLYQKSNPDFYKEYNQVRELQIKKPLIMPANEESSVLNTGNESLEEVVVVKSKRKNLQAQEVEKQESLS